MPLISILIPAYKEERYISRCLDSALSQTFEDVEVVVVDDCSTDRTPEIVAEYAARDNRLRLIRHLENMGSLWARKSCIEAAKGDYVTFLDADDTLEPEACSRMLQVALEEDADMVAGVMRYRMLDGSVSSFPVSLPYGGDSYGVVKALVDNKMSHNLSSKLLKRELLGNLDFGPFVHLNSGDDAIIFYQLARFVKKAVVIKDDVYNYFQVVTSTTQKHLDNSEISNIALSSAIKIKTATDVDENFRLPIETRTTRILFNLINKGYDRRTILREAANNGLSYLWRFRSLVSHFGLNKSLLYWFVFNFGPIPFTRRNN